MSPDYTSDTREYLDEVSRAIYGLDPERLDRIAGLIVDAVRNNRPILLAGNGGSLATVSHFATDLEKCVQAGLPINKRKFPHVPRVHVIGGNASILTAWANDTAWETALAWQVHAHGPPQSLLVVLSASGASKNLSNSVMVAHRNDLQIVGLLGRAGSPISEWCDILVEVGTENVQLAEDCHSVICHALFREVHRQLCRQT